MTDKLCPRCGETKPASEFYLNRKHRDSLSSYCKPCSVAKAMEGYVSHPREKLAPEGFKHCPACKTVKPIRDFGNNRAQWDGLQSRCKPCCVAAVTASRHKDPTAHRRSSKNWREKNLDRHADNNAKWKYGIGHGTYAMMFEAQGGKCAICKTTEPGGNKGRFSIDHCHETKEVRGLLCASCNNGLGRFKHNPDFLDAGADYLRNPPARIILNQISQRSK